MHTCNILGIDLSFYNLREAREKSDSFLTNGALHTIQYITGQMLLHSSKDADCKGVLQNTDLLLCADSKILRAAGINARSRNYEIEKNLYFKEFVKMIKQRQLKVYILSDTKERMEKLLNVLHSYFDDDMKYTTCILEQLKGNLEFVSIETIANEINDFAPNLILSCLSFPYQLYLIDEIKSFLNAQLWLGFPPDPLFLLPKKTRSFPCFQKLSQKLFQKRISLYENIQNTNENR